MRSYHYDEEGFFTRATPTCIDGKLVSSTGEVRYVIHERSTMVPIPDQIIPSGWHWRFNAVVRQWVPTMK